MPYYVRVFCKSKKVPHPDEVLAFVNNQGYNFKLEIDEATLDGDRENWRSFEMNYKDGKGPIVVERNPVDDDNELGKEEIAEFLEQIGRPGLSLKKRKVISHLKQTTYIIANQLLGDIDDDGYDANGAFIKYFVNNFEGMQQADGEGFYDAAMNLLCNDR